MAVTLGSHNAQVALSSEEQKEVLLRLRRDLRSIQEALRVVTTAMGFLAGEGGRLDMPLSQYLLKVLRLHKTEFCERVLLGSVFMPITCTEVLLRLVKLLQYCFFFFQCTLQHILSLWETLALEKVRMHSLNGMEVRHLYYMICNLIWLTLCTVIMPGSF